MESSFRALSEAADVTPPGAPVKRGKGKDKKTKKRVSKKSKNKRKKASFKTNAKGIGLKAADYKAKSSKMYKDYDISAIPQKAWPDESKTNAGKQSYTLTHKDCAIEVLLKHNAFFCKASG